MTNPLLLRASAGRSGTAVDIAREFVELLLSDSPARAQDKLTNDASFFGRGTAKLDWTAIKSALGDRSWDDGQVLTDEALDAIGPVARLFNFGALADNDSVVIARLNGGGAGIGMVVRKKSVRRVFDPTPLIKRFG